MFPNSFLIESRVFVVLVLTSLVGIQNVAGQPPLPDWKRSYLPTTDRWKKTEQVFVFNNGTEPESLDPALITGVPEGRIVGALFEGLVDLGPKTLVPRPGVAKDWVVSDDGLTYTFNLRPDARWSDGKAVTADDFHHSWKRVLTPKTAAAYAYQLFPVKGAEAFHKGTLDSFEQVGIKAIDQQTLQVVLESPCSYFLDLVAFHTLFPVRADVVAAHGSQWTRPETLIGNGAFRLKAWLPRQKVVLEKNPHYWDRTTCKLTQVTVLPYDDLDTAYRLFTQGKISWMPAIPQDKLEEIRRHPDYYVMPYMGSYFYRFNVQKPPFNDARVRKALSLAVDRRGITDHVLKGGQQPATWFCPAVGGYTPVAGLPYNKEEARKLLMEAGFGESGRPFPKVEILYNTSEGHKKVAEAIVQQWKQNLGISVSLRNVEWKVLLSDMSNLNFQIIRSSWIGDYGDPNTFFDMFTTGNGNNRTGWSNAEYDSLTRAAALERDVSERMKIFQRMERILVEEEFPILPLYIYVNQGMLHESVYGWHENIRDMHPLKYIWLEE